MPHNIMQDMQVLSSSPFHAITEIRVRISSDSADREIYRVGRTKAGSKWVDLYGIAKVGLERLMIAAGIEETSSDSHVSKERVWQSKWTGKYVQPDGKEIPLSGEKELDLRVGGTRWDQRVTKDLDNLLKAEGAGTGAFVKSGSGYKVKGGTWVKDKDIILFSLSLPPERAEEIQKVAEAQATRYVRQAAQFGLELAQTGARHRAIRAIMQIGQYTKVQLQEDFIVIRSRFDMAAMQEQLGPVMVKNMLAAQAGAALGLSDSVIQGLLSAPTPTETVDVEAEVAINGEPLMEFEEYVEQVFGGEGAVESEAELVPEPLPQPSPQQAETPPPAPKAEEKTSAFTQPIDPELVEWLKESYHLAKFPNLGSLVGYATELMVGIENLTHGEGCNLRRFVNELSKRPNATTEELTELKKNLKAIVLRHNEGQKLWIADEDMDQLALPEGESE